jgi:lysozyme family protein
MQHPYLQLKDEYEGRLASLKITRAAEAEARARRLLSRPEVLSNFEPVEGQLGIPTLWMICSFERESSMNFKTSPAQGDPWNRVSTHVPAGVGPFKSFTEAALWSYRHDGLDRNSFPWTWSYMMWAWEKFNGFGPRDHGRVSGYVLAGTDQYDPPTGRGGKYVADGQWSSSTVDTQLGCVPLAVCLAHLEPRLMVPGFPSGPIVLPTPLPITPTPVGVGGGQRGAIWIQHALNQLKVEGTPLAEDGSYGRMTRTAVRAYQAARGLDQDGLAGPKTIAALEAEVAVVH